MRFLSMFVFAAVDCRRRPTSRRRAVAGQVRQPAGRHVRAGFHIGTGDDCADQRAHPAVPQQTARPGVFLGPEDIETGDFFAMSDNGFGAKPNSPDYVLRLYRIDDLQGAAAQFKRISWPTSARSARTGRWSRPGCDLMQLRDALDPRRPRRDVSPFPFQTIERARSRWASASSASSTTTTYAVQQRPGARTAPIPTSSPSSGWIGPCGIPLD